MSDDIAVANVVTPEPEITALAADINAEHERAFGKATEALEHARRAGELLLQAKAAVGHGEWLPWVEANCKFSVRTAQGYIRLAQGWETLSAKCATVAHLGLREALTLLAEHPTDPRPEVMRQLRDEILASNDFDYIHFKMCALWEIAGPLFQTTKDLQLLAEFVKDARLEAHVAKLHVEVIANIGRCLIELKKMTGLNDSDLLAVINDGSLIRACNERITELEKAAA